MAADLIGELFRFIMSGRVGRHHLAAAGRNDLRRQRTQPARTSDNERGASSELGRCDELCDIAHRSLDDRWPTQEGLYRSVYTRAVDGHPNHPKSLICPVDSEPECALPLRGLDQVDCERGENRV